MRAQTERISPRRSGRATEAGGVLRGPAQRIGAGPAAAW